MLQTRSTSLLHAYRHPSHDRISKPSCPSPCHGLDALYHCYPMAYLGCLIDQLSIVAQHLVLVSYHIFILVSYIAFRPKYLFLISELNRCQHLIIDSIAFFLTKDYPLTLLSKYHSDKRGYLLGLRFAFSFNLGQFILDYIRQRLMRFLCRKLKLLQQFLTFGRILVTKDDERLHEHFKHIS